MNRGGAFLAGMTALLVAAAMIALRILEWMTGLVVQVSLGQYYSLAILQVLLVVIPFALGYFVSLWIFAPIAPESGLSSVVVRAGLATAVGTAVFFVLALVLGVLGSFGFEGYLFGQYFPTPSFDGSQAGAAVTGALMSAGMTFVGTLPLGVLAAVLLWLRISGRGSSWHTDQV